MADYFDLQVIDEEIEEQLSDKESISPPGSCYDSEEDVPKQSSAQLNCSRKDELSQLKNKLFEEFDSLGLCQTKENDYSDTDLVTNAFNLVNIHRKIIGQVKDGNFDSAKLRGDKLQLEKQIDSLQKVIDKKDDAFKTLNKKLVLMNMKCEDLEKEKANLQQELQNARKMLSSKDNEWEHKIKQLESENQNLKSACGKTLGTYKSRDAVTVAVLQKYKANETHYKDTIKKLQENNQGLIKQLLSLLEQDHPNTCSS